MAQSRLDATPETQRTRDLSQTRRALLDLLKRNGELDVAAMARALRISHVAVRQHLAALEQAGEVAARVVRRPVGRPARLYRLTAAAEKAFPQSSDAIALDLLSRLEQQLGPEALSQLFEARLKDLSKAYKDRLAKAKTPSEKLAVLAQIRDEEGYLANVERDAATGREVLVEHHCPVAAIAKRHPQVCRYEIELFRRVLGEPKLERAEHILSGAHTCTYRLPEAKKDA